MLFAILSIILIAFSIFRITYYRFLAVSGISRLYPAPSLLAKYAAWMRKSAPPYLSRDRWKKAQSGLWAWVAPRYPGWRVWILACLALSFLYLAASGLGFAIFSRRGLYGVPLLLHVSAGGLFAVSLAAVMIFRAREFQLEDKGEASALARCMAFPFVTDIPLKLLEKCAFWGYILASLVLIITALASMMPYFTFKAQLGLIEIHRYGALVSILAAMTFVDAAVVPRGS